MGATKTRHRYVKSRPSSPHSGCATTNVSANKLESNNRASTCRFCAAHLDLWGVQVHRNDMVGTWHWQHVGHQLGRNRSTALHGKQISLVTWSKREREHGQVLKINAEPFNKITTVWYHNVTGSGFFSFPFHGLLKSKMDATKEKKKTVSGHGKTLWFQPTMVKVRNPKRNP